MNFKVLECRKEPILCKHEIIIEEGSFTTKAKKKTDYTYYICDECKEKIIMYDKKSDRDGGIVAFKIDEYKEVKVALHNRCFNKAKRNFNETYDLNI